MRYDAHFDSCGAGQIHYYRWTPEGQPRAVVQIVHGIAEFAARYDDFARYLNRLGYLVVADDHMGHGKSILHSTQGYFTGGWFAAVADSFQLLEMTRKEFPDLPYVLLGHSMGSFMARTILCKYPDSGITAAILSGTGWQPRQGLPVMHALCKAECRRIGEKAPSKTLDKLIFGGYNRRVEHPKTKFDWLTRDQNVVDTYIAHPSCGFVASAGLMRDLMEGLMYIESEENLAAMDKKLPVLFIAGGDDPVGSYGKGVRRTAEEFKKAGMEQVDTKIYPLCRHEILNEINRREVYEDVSQWMEKQIFEKTE